MIVIVIRSTAVLNCGIIFRYNIPNIGTVNEKQTILLLHF